MESIPNCLLELKLALLLIHAAKNGRDEILLPVFKRFVTPVGDNYLRELAGTTNAKRRAYIMNQNYPFSLRTAVRGFLCSVLCGLHEMLCSDTDETLVIRSQLDEFMEYATFDVRCRNRINYTPPATAGIGCQKIWTYVQFAFPTMMCFNNNTLDMEDLDQDPVKSAPIYWIPQRVETFLALARIMLCPQCAVGKSRKLPSKTYNLPGPLAEYLPPSVIQLVRDKEDWSWFGKIVPPCPRGSLKAFDSVMGPILYLTYPGGMKKSGPIENPFGSAKGYDEAARKVIAAETKRKRIAKKKASNASPKPTPDLISEVLKQMGRKRRAPHITGTSTDFGGKDKRSAIATPLPAVPAYP